MYVARRNRSVADDEVTATGDGRSWRGFLIAPNVVMLGLTSLVTDISSEMVAAVLPLYLTVHLGFTALQFGATDGLLQLATAITALVGALAADRWRRYREVAGIGYGASAASRLGVLAATGWLPLLGWLSADRIGKGMRTGPRDALISLSAPPGRLGEAFGLHRTLDTGGALLGPLLAVVLLTVAPGSYATVFISSFLIALVGLALLWLFVENRHPISSAAKAGHAVWKPVAALWAHRPFRRVLLAAALLSVPAVSDSFLFLTLRRRVGIEQRWFPILFVGESIIYLLFALPFGRLADRIGAGRVLLGGQVALGASFVLLIVSPSRAVLLLALPACLGLFFAATDGVLASLASQAVPGLTRTTGLAIVAVAVAGGRALAATGYGAAWQRYGPHRAVVAALCILVVAAAAAAVVLRPFLFPRSRPGGSQGGDRPAAFQLSTTATTSGSRTGPAHRRRRMKYRLAAFAGITVLCIGSIVAVAWRANQHTTAASLASGAHLATLTPTAAHTSSGQPTVALDAPLEPLLARPHLLVVDTATGDNFGRVEVADAADPAGPRAPTALTCDRIDQRAGRGICLTNDPVNAIHGISVFDDHFKVLFRLPLDGLPSRTRVAPNGQIGAATSFVDGDAYNLDSFSTRTTLLDLINGKPIADLENFAVTKNGRRFYAIDENFWGVTFAADSDTFYATLRTGGHYYLIRGHVHTRRAEILRDGVECPAISPDGTRLAFKSRIEHGFDPATWQLHVLDLTTLTDHPLAETRNVDDQANWLDNSDVIYGVQQTNVNDATIDTWKVPADGTGTPTLLIPTGQSPTPAT